MPDPEEAQPAHPPRRARRSHDSATVAPVFPLLLLETMRDMDRPAEVLEDEDLSVSLPRRLGLSDVVGSEIRRLREDMERGRLQGDHVVQDLIRLVIRRPDAEEIFVEAGRRVARHAWEERSGLTRNSVPRLPHPVALAAARRAARRLLKRLIGPGHVWVRRRPVEMRIAGSVGVAADPGGVACAFYSGVFAELLHQYTGRPYRVGHSHCETRGAEVCEWTALPGEEGRGKRE